MSLQLQKRVRALERQLIPGAQPIMIWKMWDAETGEVEPILHGVRMPRGLSDVEIRAWSGRILKWQNARAAAGLPWMTEPAEEVWRLSKEAAKGG